MVDYSKRLDENAVDIQRNYYAETGDRYDEMHVRENDLNMTSR